MLKKIDELWPVSIRPAIDGVSVVYHSDTESFEYNKRIYKIRLGKKTYRPIVGYLFVSQIDLEKMNYKRAQKNLPLFKSVTEAVLYILEQNRHFDLLLFAAYGILSKNNELASEKELLRTIGYITLSEYYPETVQEAVNFLELFSTNQDQEERSRLFGMSKQIIFDKLEVCGNKDGFLFCNQNLSVKPKITNVNYNANAKGEIICEYEFEPIEILGRKFDKLSKHFAPLTEVTLVNNQLYDLTEESVSEHLLRCPACNSLLEKNLCMNYFCKEKVIDRAYSIASRDGLNIGGLSKNMLRRIYDYLTQIVKIPENRMSDVFFFYISKKDIEQLNLKSAQADLLLNSIENALKRQKLSTIIEALKIEGLDRIGAKAISKIYDNDIEALIKSIEQEAHEDFEPMHYFKKKIGALKSLNNFIQEII